MKNKIFVTGATGFVGSRLVRALVEKNEDVSILVRNKKLNNRLKDISHNLHVYQGDLLSDALKEIIDQVKPNVVFHLAAHGAIPRQQITVNELLDVNVKGVIRLLNAVKKHKLKLFVNTGSSSEYGIKDIPMNEADFLCPINDYGVSKAAATLYCQKIAVTESIPIITLRLFSPYGYRDDDSRLIPFVINKALRNESISLTSQKHVRDFIAVEDVIAAYLQTLVKHLSPGEIINIGSGKQHSVYDIVSNIITLTGSKSQLDWNTKPSQQRQIEPKKWQANILKAKELLEWKPKLSLIQGLGKTIRHYENQNYD
jgi:nucleoside-diphosphate-sugar epimerase